MPRIHDITFSLEPSLTVWPGDTEVCFEIQKDADDPSGSIVSRLVLSSHAGTHVDAPRHFLPGARTVESLDLDVLIGDALVVAVDSPDLSASVLEALSIPFGVERIIFKTSNSARFSGVEPFFDDYVGVTASGAGWLVDRGLALVGIDYLSVAARRDTAEVHRLLLGSDMVLLETLDLRAVDPGWYQLICLPLKLDGVDGSPARAVLVEK